MIDLREEIEEPLDGANEPPPDSGRDLKRHRAPKRLRTPDLVGREDDDDDDERKRSRRSGGGEPSEPDPAQLEKGRSDAQVERAGPCAEPVAKKKASSKRRPRTKRERMREAHHEILDVEGAAEVLGISRRLVLRLLREGRLPGKKVGREWRLSRSAILQWLKTPDVSTVQAKSQPKWLEDALRSGRAEVGGEERRARG